MAGNNGNGTTPPYASFTTFQRFIDMLVDRGLPSRIDRTVWHNDFSGSDGAHVTATMRFLGLLNDDDEPTERLERLVESSKTSEAEGKEVLAEALKDGYAPILQRVDMSSGTYKELKEAFDAHFASMGTSTRKKADAFFRKATEHAGLLTSTYILKPPRRSSKKKTNKSKKSTSTKAGATKGKKEAEGAPEAPKTEDRVVPEDYRTISIPVPGHQEPVEIVAPVDMQPSMWSFVSDFVKKYLELEANGGGDNE